MDEQDLMTKEEYKEAYTEKNFFDKVKAVAKKAGIKVIYSGLLLFYTFQKPRVPKWAKRIIIGALGYFILPIDIIPDLLPGGGYVDDFGAIALALGTVAMYIDKDIRLRAKLKLKDWFGNYDEKLIIEVDEKIEK